MFFMVYNFDWATDHEAFKKRQNSSEGPHMIRVDEDREYRKFGGCPERCCTKLKSDFLNKNSFN